MIPERRLQEMRERLHDLHASVDALMPQFLPRYADIILRAWEDITDLLTEREELIADNAAIRQAALPLIPNMDQGEYHPLALVLSQKSSGTALLARHAEELAAKDALNAALVLDAAKELNRTKALQAELDRTREALRERVVTNYFGSTGRCSLCDGSWPPTHNPDGKRFGEESHNPVIINGVEGPCPARKEDL